MTSAKFDRLFGGPPRQPESQITQREMDLARSVQVVTEEAMMKMCGTPTADAPGHNTTREESTSKIFDVSNRSRYFSRRANINGQTGIW